MRFLRRIRFLLRRETNAADVAEELGVHLRMLEDEHRAAGMSPEEALEAARRRLGSPTRAREEARRVSVPRWLETVVQDLRYALRGFRRSPGFAVTALLALTLGIGANTAIFSVINGAILRPLPVRASGELVEIGRQSSDGSPGRLSYAMFDHLRENLRSVSDILAIGTGRASVVVGGEEDLLSVDLVSGDYFRTLGLTPQAGRLLTREDDVIAPPSPAAVLSDRYWSTRFGRSPAVVGQAITVGGRTFTIAGVAPASFRSVITGDAPDVILPLLPMMPEEQRLEPTNHWLHVLARRRPGVSAARVDAEVRVAYAAFLQELARAEPADSRAEILRRQAAAFPAPGGSNPVAHEIGAPLAVLMATVGLILTLICVNLSALLLARTAARRREVSVRLAIGASRGRLVRQLLTENVALVAIGAALGLVLAYGLSRRLVSLFAEGTGVVLSVTTDVRVLAFTAGIAALACVIATVGPTIRSLRADLNPSLKDSHARSARLGEKAVIVTQVSISMVLLVGASLFVGTLVNLYAVDPGFDDSEILVLNVRGTRTFGDDEAPRLQQEILQRLSALPAVDLSSAVYVLPIGGNLWSRLTKIQGEPARPAQEVDVGFNVIAPDYFATMGTPLLAGREFTDRDDATAPRVAIMNESFARGILGGGSAVGRAVTSAGVTYEIVGVVGDTRYQDLRDAGRPTLYISWMQRKDEQPSSYHYLVRGSRQDARRLTPALRELMRNIDPDLKLESLTPYTAIVARSITAERIVGSLAGLFGVLALVVAGLGISGVLASQVSRRTNELGVRKALGASGARLVRLVVAEVGWLVASGIVAGTVAGSALSRFASSLVFGFQPDAPGVFLVAAGMLAAAAMIAAWLPAQRAARVDPLIALRHE